MQASDHTGMSGTFEWGFELDNEYLTHDQFMALLSTDRGIIRVANMIMDAYDEACESLKNSVAARHLDYIK